MKCIVFKPIWYGQIEDVENELEALQETVGGYIEVLPLTDKVAIVCNDEGKINDLVRSAALFQKVKHCSGVYRVNDLKLTDVIFGPFILCGVDGEDFCDLPMDELKISRYEQRPNLITGVEVGDWFIKAK